MVTVTDMYLAAFLMARGRGVRLVQLPGSVTGSRCHFLFPPTAKPDVEAFENGQAVSAAGFADAHRRLKFLMARAPLSMQPTGAGR
jgi:hypothetical protein